MRFLKGILATFLFFNVGLMNVHAEEAEENESSTEDIVGENDVREENHSEYVVPTAEDLEGVTEMKVTNNVDERGNVFDHEKLVGTKQFLTVVTPDGRTYYIVISYEQFGTTVNLLKDMTETDVEAVASGSEPQAGSMTPAQAQQQMDKNATGDGSTEEIVESEESVGPNLMIVGIVALVGVGFAFYKFKNNKSSDSTDDLS